MDFLLIGCCEVTGWYSGNLNHHPSVSSQCGVYVLVVSMQSSPSTCVEVLVSAEQLKDMHRLLCVSLEEELGLCFIAEAIFLNCFSFILSLVTVSESLKLREGLGDESLFLQRRNKDREEPLCPGGPWGPCLATLPASLWSSVFPRGTRAGQERE